MALALVQTAMAEVVAVDVEVLAKVVASRYLPRGPRRPWQRHRPPRQMRIALAASAAAVT